MLKIKSFLKTLSIFILAITVISFWAEQVYLNSDIFDSESDSEYGFCNVSKIKLQGELMPYIPNEDKNEDGSTAVDATSSEDIVDAIEIADNDENIQAIILEINSFGGGPVAAEEVANALKRATKPTVALIRGMGVSAAYWSAIGADVIIASANSDVGSIGITSSYLDNTEKNEKEGLTFNQISTGKFKDMLSYDKPLTQEERKLVERDLKILHENFVTAISENRKIDIEKVRKLADGSSMPGQMALDNGLIDKIGGINEVKNYLAEKIGEEVEICQ